MKSTVAFKFLFTLLPFASGKEQPQKRTVPHPQKDVIDGKHNSLRRVEEKSQTTSQACTIVVADALAIKPGENHAPEIMCKMNPSDMGGHANLVRIIEGTDQQKKDLLDMWESNEIRSGKSKLNHGLGAYFDDECIALPADLDVKINISHGPDRRQLSSTMGDTPILAVRVTDKYGRSVSEDAANVSSNIFGTDAGHVDTVNLKSQLEACSFGQVQVLAGVGDENEAAPGVIEVSIDEALEDGEDLFVHSYTVVWNAVVAAVEDLLEESLPGPYQHVMVIMPPCEDCWFAAWAFFAEWGSLFQGSYYSYPNTQLKQWGFNKDLGMSGVFDGTGFDADGDLTCSMGTPQYGDDAGEMCFNPAKSWQLGWFNHFGGQKLLDPSVGAKSFESAVITIVGSAEYDVRKKNHTQPVTVKLETATGSDFFLGFNRATGANSGVMGSQDKVTVTQVEEGDGEARAYSAMLSDLGEGDMYTIGDFASTGDDLKVSVSRIDTDSTAPGVAIVCVTYNDDGLCCSDQEFLQKVANHGKYLCKCQGNCKTDFDCLV